MFNVDAGIAAVIGAGLGALGTTVVGIFKASKASNIGMTQAQAQMLTDSWAQVNSQRAIIERQDVEIMRIRDQVMEERKECDRRLAALQARIEQIERNVEDDSAS